MFPNHTHVPMRGLPILSISTWKQYTQGLAGGDKSRAHAHQGPVVPRFQGSRPQETEGVSHGKRPWLGGESLGKDS